MRLIFFSVVFLNIAFGKGNMPNSLYRTDAEVLGPRSFEVELFGSMFNSFSTIDEAGSENALDPDQGFSVMDGGLVGRYCFKIPFEVRIGLNGRVVTSVDGTEEFSTMGLESYWVGARYGFTQGINLKYSLDFKYRMTSYANTRYNPAAIPATFETMELGDSGAEVSVGLNVAYFVTRKNTIALSALYRMPPSGNELSPEIYYKGEIAWSFRNFALLIGGEGIYSLNQSSYGTNPSVRPVISGGVSELFNSVNRTRLDPYAGVNLAFSSIRFTFRGAYTLSGNSTDRGYRFWGSVAWTGKGKEEGHKQKIKSFKEYEIEASVIKVSPRSKFVKIDQGMAHDVEKGMRFDIYKSDYFGGNILIATGVIYEVGAGWSIIKIQKKYRKVNIEKGFYARGI